MKTNYRGFEIEANREMSLGGSSNIYYTVMRKDDGLFLEDGFYETDDTIRDFINDLKLTVDDYYEIILKIG